MKKLLFLVNVDWFFLSHRLPIALAAKKNGYETHIATSITDKWDELSSHEFIIHPLLLARTKASLFDEIKASIKIISILKKVQPDVLHLVTIKPVLYGGIAARIVGINRVVAAISGLGFVFTGKGWKNKIRQFLVSLIYKLALNQKHLKVIFQNPNDRDTLTKVAKLKNSQIAMIPGSGVDLSLYYGTAPAKTTPVIILAARLLHDKGVGVFVEAAQQLKQQGVNARFCLVGTPDTANPTSVTPDELSQWVNDGIVEAWGHRTDMPQVLSTAHIVVLPSYYGEGLPKVLIEAAACGRAVITTDMPGCRDAIIPNITGLLVPPRNVEALVEAINTLLQNPELRDNMGKAGRKLAEERYAIEQVVATHLTIYQELLDAT